MEDNQQYVDAVEQSLEQYRTYLNRKALPSMREEFQRLHGAFKNLYSVLMKKSLIRDDPYKNDLKISEIEPPSTDDIPDSEKSVQVSLRLSMFDSQLEFLLSYYQFNDEYLTLKRIKLLAALLRFINWNNVSENSSHVNTRLLGDLLAKIRGGSDTFSTQLINDGLSQMSQASTRITALLKSLAVFQRELYKLQLRKTVFAGVSLSPAFVTEDREGAMGQIKRTFAANLRGVPFYQELVEEVMDEDLGPEGPQRRKQILASLQVQEKKQEAKKPVSHRPLVVEALRLLAGAGRHIMSAAAKLEEASALLESGRRRGDNILMRLLHRLFAPKQESRSYTVGIMDPATSIVRPVSVDFEEFMTKTSHTVKILGTITARTSSGSEKLDTMNESALYKALEDTIVEAQRIAQLLPALMDHFQEEADKDTRAKMRGIRLEMNAIRNAVVKANQRRHEYVAMSEEQEQLRKLGVRTGRA